MSALSITRRSLALGAPLILALGRAARANSTNAIVDIEKTHGGRLGVFALDTRTGRTLAHRADERFLLASTFKGPLAALVLSRIDAGQDNPAQRIAYTVRDLLPASPVTSANVAAGSMAIADLVRAILERSDNTAANLLLRHAGGPAGLTAYIRERGDTVTRIDRYEPIGGWSGEKDTTTPRAIAGTARATVLGPALKPVSQSLLRSLMQSALPGRTRLRASFPAGWRAGDRTGTADGVCNDYAVAWPPGRAPVVIAAYYEQPALDMPAQEAVLRATGSAIVTWLAS